MLAFVAGCATVAPKEPIPLANNALDPKSGRIGVGMTAVPKVDTAFPGAGCLLCLATASAANSDLTKHCESLTHEDLPTLKKTMADRIHKKGSEVILIPDTIDIDALPDFTTDKPNVSPKDFSQYRTKYQIDKLVVIDIKQLGFTRPYSAYFSTGDPKATMQGNGYLIDLKTNTYEWYLPVTISKSADGNWDEPPKYPGLTNAYYQVLELGKDAFLNPFNK